MATLEIVTCSGCGEKGPAGTKCPSCGGYLVPKDMDETKKLIDAANAQGPQGRAQLNQFLGQCTAQLAANPNDEMVNSSLGMYFLSLKMYDKAWTNFNKIVDNFPSNPETYFWAAVCLLKGKKAFLALRPTIDKILEYVNAACMLEDRGIYHYFLAYIKYDYFARKSYRTSPDWKQEYNMAASLGTARADCNRLFDILGVDKPDVL